MSDTIRKDVSRTPRLLAGLAAAEIFVTAAVPTLAQIATR